MRKQPYFGGVCESGTPQKRKTPCDSGRESGNGLLIALPFIPRAESSGSVLEFEKVPLLSFSDCGLVLRGAPLLLLGYLSDIREREADSQGEAKR